jgi:hypothetical protein
MWLDRLLTWLKVERHDIGRKDTGTYLTRWVLWGTRFGPGRKVFLHLFHRGDAEPYFHNHPWPFWSLILRGGYTEWTPTPLDEVVGMGPQVGRWYGPLSLLRRPASWRHRVTLPEGRRCWTLVWVGLKAQSWGFFCPGTGFLPWRQHEANQAAGKPGCGE